MYSLQAVIRKSINNATSQFERLGTVGTNLANLNTNGYKAVRFEEMLHEDGYVSSEMRTDYKSGSIRITSNPNDIAIKEAGFFPVISEAGEIAYTRDGALKIGKGGYLMTSDNWIVGNGIKIPTNCYKMTIKPNGDVMGFDFAGDTPEKLGNIPIVRFDCQEGLQSKGSNKLVPTEESGQPKLVLGHDFIQQNCLENSNANVHASVNEMLRLNASMLASMRMIKVVDDMYNKSINIRE